MGTVVAAEHGPVTHPDVRHVGDRVQRSGRAATDADAEVAGAAGSGVGHGPATISARTMGILTLGISFRRAPIELLERLAFGDDDLTKAYRRVEELDGVDEAVVLSTCNRVEVYGSVASYHAGFLSLKRLLAESRGVDLDELAEPLYSHWEQDAAEHLFSVAAGLDSMVLGETQIAAQVREAVRTARSAGIAGSALTGLFHAATRAGRRVRQETALGAAPDAFVTLGATLAADALGGLAGRSVVVIGAGQMAALAVKHLRRAGVGSIRVVNRSGERAKALAERTGADHGDLDLLPAALADADLVVSATGAAGYVVHHGAVARAMQGRDARGLVLLDLAVPRDVDPEVAYVDGVRVVDIVTIRERIGRSRRSDRRRHRASPRARGRGGPPVGRPAARRRARSPDLARSATEATRSSRASSRGGRAGSPTSRPTSTRPSRPWLAAWRPSCCTIPSWS